MSESEEPSASRVRDTRKQPLDFAAISAVPAASSAQPARQPSGSLKLGSACMPPGSSAYTPAVYLRGARSGSASHAYTVLEAGQRLHAARQ